MPSPILFPIILGIVVAVMTFFLLRTYLTVRRIANMPGLIARKVLR